MIVDLEMAELAKILPSIPGYYALHLGGPSHVDMLKQSQIRHKYYCNDGVVAAASHQSIQTDYYLMPFIEESLNLVVMTHVLEFCEDPRLILNEAYRLLKPGGQLIMMGFNSSSLWRISQWRRGYSGYPWSGRFLSLWQLRHWALKIGYGIVLDKSLCFLPPREQRFSDKWLRVMDAMGQTLSPRFGAIYFIYAQKKVAGMTPLVASWANEVMPIEG